MPLSLTLRQIPSSSENLDEVPCVLVSYGNLQEQLEIAKTEHASTRLFHLCVTNSERFNPIRFNTSKDKTTLDKVYASISSVFLDRTVTFLEERLGSPLQRSPLSPLLLNKRLLDCFDENREFAQLSFWFELKPKTS